MILAAGEGRRMRPLTDTKPKPLIEVAGRPLLEHHIEALVAAGITKLVINASYLAAQIVDFCGDGSRWGCRIHISLEDSPLETGGGIIRALPLLDDAPFIVVNGDVFTDYPLSRLCAVELGDDLAHLIMVPNPSQHPAGDFPISHGRLAANGALRATFAGLSVVRRELFASAPAGIVPLKPLLDLAIASGRVSGELWHGHWSDVGTPHRLSVLKARLSRAAD